MANSAIRRNPKGQFTTAEELKAIIDAIKPEDVTRLANDFVSVKEIAALYGVDPKTFWHRFGDDILTGYLQTRVELKSTILSKARSGERWALDRLAGSVLSWKEGELIDLEIPEEEKSLSPQEVTEALRRVK